MTRGNRLFVGERVRQLRAQGRMDQADMARLLGISVPYLSQLENNDRPLTARVKSALAAAFPLDWSDFDERPEEQLLGAFNWALVNSGNGSSPPEPERTERLHIQYPEFAARYVELHHLLRQTEQRLAMAEEALGGSQAFASRAPWDEVTDWFQSTGNYCHELDLAAEDLAGVIGIAPSQTVQPLLIDALARDHGCDARFEALEPTSLRALAPDGRSLLINASLPEASRNFQLASHLATLRFRREIEGLLAGSPALSDTATRLLHHALVNYAAAALLMPYGAIRSEARSLRHDLDVLAKRFSVSVEQLAHRLSTLQRPGQKGVPFFFCRIDAAGNIIKRHSATSREFGRFGSLCPLWSGHEAAALADSTLVQSAEMPDGTRYISFARGIEKPLPASGARPRRYAVALVCEATHASHLIYADQLDLSDEKAATPIGPGCRLCPRDGCQQRAFPPIDRPIHVERDERHVISYSIG